MQLFVSGSVPKEVLLNKINFIIEDLAKTIGIDNDINVFIESADIKVSFEINGEKNFATVTRGINGEKIPEILQVSVKLDENGEIDFEENNEKESFHDGYTLAQAAGTEYEYEGIESPYSNEDLEILSHIEDSETDDKKVMAVRYKIKNVPGKILIRYYKGEKIVAERVVIENMEE